MVTPPADENVNDLLNQEHDQWIYRRMPLKLLFGAIWTTAKSKKQFKFQNGRKRGFSYYSKS
jgi:hypothetical protein